MSQRIRIVFTTERPSLGSLDQNTRHANILQTAMPALLQLSHVHASQNMQSTTSSVNYAVQRTWDKQLEPCGVEYWNMPNTSHLMYTDTYKAKIQTGSPNSDEDTRNVE